MFGKTMTKPATAPQFRTHADIPGVQAVQTVLNGLHARGAHVREQIEALQAELADMPKGNALDQDAAALLSGNPRPKMPSAIRAELAAKEQEWRVIQRAIEMQDAPLEEAKRRASRELCEERLSRHRELVEVKRAAIVTLIEAENAERDFLDQMEREGIRVVEPMKDARLWVVGNGVAKDERCWHLDKWLADHAAYLDS